MAGRWSCLLCGQAGESAWPEAAWRNHLTDCPGEATPA